MPQNPGWYLEKKSQIIAQQYRNVSEIHYCFEVSKFFLKDINTSLNNKNAWNWSKVIVKIFIVLQNIYISNDASFELFFIKDSWK